MLYRGNYSVNSHFTDDDKWLVRSSILVIYLCMQTNVQTNENCKTMYDDLQHPPQMGLEI